MNSLFRFCGLCLVLAPFTWTPPANAATTINSVNKFSYGANIGWMDWRGDVTSGAVIGEFICTGNLYAANTGWIRLGSGTPANGIRYQNNSATDYGVNHDGLGNLRGFAHGADIGWLNFTNRDATGAFYAGPKVDLLTGRMSGFVWSANCGWISLSNQFAFVQTDTLRMGADGDGDGIPDAWEQLHFGNLSTANGFSDRDGDGVTDLDEYGADTDPTDPNSHMRITTFSSDPGGSPAKIEWTSVATRQYRVQKRTDLNPGFPWIDAGLGLIVPDAGPTTTRDVTDSTSPERFFRIEAIKPLSP
jgi:hypothetical protein